MTLRWFVHVDAPVAWRVVDPIDWCLFHRHISILRPARPVLDAAVFGDDGLVIPAVLESCRLNLVTLDRAAMVVRHWGPESRADVRSLVAHEARAARPTSVVFHDDRAGVTSEHVPSMLRWGSPTPADWPVDTFRTKWQQRRLEEDDDRATIPDTGNGLIQPIPCRPAPTWAELKRIWASRPALRCRDCGRPAIVAGKGCMMVDAFRWRPRYLYACLFCQTLHVRDPQRNLWIDATNGVHGRSGGCPDDR